MGVENLSVFVKDARVGISQSNQQYDIVSVDAYRPPYIPWHLTTKEFFTEVYQHLTDKGTVVINVARIFDDRRLVDTLYTTISSVFPSAYVIDIPNTLNTIIFATKKPTEFNNLLLNYLHISEDKNSLEILINALEVAILNQKPNPSNGILLTDDYAPIEKITNSMIYELFFSEKIEDLQ